MDELIRCTLTKEYIPFDSKIHPYCDQLFAMCNNMMNTDVQQRATLKQIISNPMITIAYYHSYFQFDV